MSSGVKNIAIVLGLATVAFAGYYMYTQQAANTLSFDESDQQLQNMLANSQLFIERRRELSKIDFDTSVLGDSRFVSLRSFNRPVIEQPVGRTNPFADVQGAGNSQ